MHTQFISYLDLMCCGFGGALLMFLIVASAKEERIPGQPMLVVRCRATAPAEGVVPSGAEVGIEYRKVNSVQWIRVNGPAVDGDLVGAGVGEKSSFLPRTTAGQPTESIAIFRHPRPGRWEFRAYLADFPAESQAASPLAVQIEVLGLVITQSKPLVLVSPGTTTAAIEVEIPAQK